LAFARWDAELLVTGDRPIAQEDAIAILDRSLGFGGFVDVGHVLALHNCLDYLEYGRVRIDATHQNDLHAGALGIVDGLDAQGLLAGPAAVGGAHEQVCYTVREIGADRVDFDDARNLNVTLTRHGLGIEGPDRPPGHGREILGCDSILLADPDGF